MDEIRMDPNAPGTKAFAQVLDHLRRRAVMTTSTEELRQLARQVEENRRVRQMMFGRPRPVIRDTNVDST